MLCLSRKADERIFITCPDGSEITIMVIAIQGDKARLGIEAPKSHSIHRKEIFDAIRAAKAEPQPAA